MTEHGPFGASARFSADRRYRYTLRRYLSIPPKDGCRVVFVMLNPSTADAFKLDPTVSRCAEFARRWEMNAIDVVNLFALRSPHPDDLLKVSHDERGADRANDEAILETCRGAELVIAAWGNHGYDRRTGSRALVVRPMLEKAGVELHHLGLSSLGSPLHPLARGKSFIPYDRKPVRWVPWRECGTWAP